MANGNGNGNGNGVGAGNEGEEFLVDEIRPGFRREFSIMYKAQTEYGMNVGKRRVTRSQNGIFSSRAAAKTGGSDTGFGVTKGLNAKRRKTGTKVEVSGAEVVGEKVGLDGEEEQLKSNFDDGNSEDGRKLNLVEVGVSEGEGKGKAMVGLEKIWSGVEIKSEIVSGMGGDVGQNVVADGIGDAVIGEQKGRVGYSMLRQNVGVDINGESGDLETSRRVTCSSLKPSVESLGQSRTEDVRHEEAVETDVASPMATPSKMETKTSKKVEPRNVPTKLKELLQTGLLEGLQVHYVRGSRVRLAGEEDLGGVIQGTGILCFCAKCKGTQVVTPNQFEVHAGSGNKRPPEYIKLKNGKTLRDILNVCKDAPSESLKLAIQNAIANSDAEETSRCLSCKESVPQNGTAERIFLCDSCMALRDSQPCPSESTNAITRSSLAASTSKSSVKMSSSSSRSKGQGRLTRKDLRLHKLVFDSDLLPDGTQLGYYAHGKKMRDGYKSGHGIHCHCCSEVVSPSVFEAHAGFAARRKPYLHIYTSNGVSLHELSIEIKKTLNLSTDENDDVCSICEGIGELLCCDNCPRAFHRECINLPSIPQEKWYCRYCENMFQKEKFVANNINAVAAGRIAGMDPFEEIKQRCIRIVDRLETEEGGCVLCRGRDFSISGFDPLTVIICDQCEREFHVGCLKEHQMDNLEVLPEDEWFCCKECSSIHSVLQQLVDDGDKRLPDPMLTFIRKKHESLGSEDLNIRWRVLRGKMASEEDRKSLSGAVSVFHDRFDPIMDSKSSRNDLIPFMVYGRNKRNQDFGGMYSAVLVVNSRVVCSVIFRIFGQEMAELPLAATLNKSQGKGYFRVLFNCIANLLASLNVRDLVLPAATDAEYMWMYKFGFQKMSDEQLNKYRESYPLMIFQGTSVLHKLIPKLEFPKDV